ncbi:hypothetical protein BD770DRAFT_475265 [Pilaira anomala]|nr:hypothetical protein BD770DRAFT_475265 [Pilaira anomala]
MSTHHLLTIAEILTERLINLIEKESENEDDLFTRLGPNHRAYALHNHRQRSNSSQSFTMNRDYALAIMLRRLAYPSRLTDLELILT